MRNLLCVMVLLLVPALASADAVFDRIMAMKESGEISVDQAALYLAASVVDPTLVPAAIMGSDGPARCGTPAVLEAQRMLGEVSAPVAGEVELLLARPSLSGAEQIYDTPGGHFKIHWTTSGADATSLAYVQAIGESADFSWATEIDDMGYYAPPSDLGLGGDAKYDIYVMQIDALGMTAPDGVPDPTTPNNDSSSYIMILVGMSTPLMQVTVAHEFCHASQMSYDVSEPSWFMENTSTWMEDMVYDSINDYYGYLHSGDNPLRKPWFDIREGGSTLYWYAGCIWPRYMMLRINTLAVREVWENCADVWGSNMLTAQQDMFTSHGMTWEQAFMEYGCWRWFTAVNWYAGCAMFDDEATNWTPGPYIFPYHQISTLPASGDEGAYPPDTFGIHWIRVNLANYQGGWVNMHMDGRDGFDWNLGVIMWDTAGDHLFQWYNCDASGVKDVSVSTSGWDYAVFFPALMTDTSLDKYYTWSLTYTTGISEDPGAADAIGLTISENPAGVTTSATYTLPVACTARIDVFDCAGHLVSTPVDAEAAAGQHAVELSGLGAGTYFVRLYADGQIACRRVTFLE